MSKGMFVKKIDIEGLVEFSETHPWKPQYPKSLVRRFLTELISSQDLIFDIHDQNGRVSAAVLLDKVNNPANDACLEILGMRADVEPSPLLSKFFALAKQCVPKNRSGFQVGLSECRSIFLDLLKEHGLAHYYDTYEMRQSNLTLIPLSRRSEIVDATVSDANEVYEVLCKAFAKSPDTSIPEIAAWKAAFLKSQKSHFYLWKEANHVQGFANLIEEEAGRETEIRTLGVLPEHRGKGIGRQLLNHCLSRSLDLGFKSCQLTVAVKNKNALDLYLQAGFETREKFTCYRVDINS